jgi:hypothetical protein
MSRARKVKTDRRRKPELTEASILTWADGYHVRTGEWRTREAGPIPEAPLGTTWRQVDNALRYGLRGLPGDAALAQLLAAERGVRNLSDLPPLTKTLILEWAAAHRWQTGHWPNEDSRPVAAAPGENWNAVNAALREGVRGLPGGIRWPTCLLAGGRLATGSTSFP